MRGADAYAQLEGIFRELAYGYDTVRGEHYVTHVAQYRLGPYFVASCRCGYSMEHHEMALYGSREDMFEEIFGPWVQHLKDEERKLWPTLDDLTDWGWFNVEEA